MAFAFTDPLYLALESINLGGRMSGDRVLLQRIDLIDRLMID